jgi:hypothetical protein
MDLVVTVVDHRGEVVARLSRGDDGCRSGEA